MGLIKKCKICSRSGILLHTVDGMCKKCSINLTTLNMKRKSMYTAIKHGYPGIQDNILQLKNILGKLSIYYNNGIAMDFDPKAELESLTEKEEGFILAYNIKDNMQTINQKGASSYFIEKSIYILKNELLPKFKDLESKNIKVSDWDSSNLESFIDEAERKLKRIKNKEAKVYRDKNEYVAFDLETTGLNPDTCEIIEIAAVKIKDGKIVDTFQSLIKPERKISSKITKINGITNEMVQNERSINEVLPDFIKFIEKYPLVSHNADFDFSFLSANYEKIYGKSFKRKKVCTMKLYRKEYKEWWGEKPASASLQSCVEDLLSSEDIEEHSRSAHRALNDAIMVYKIYEKLKNGYNG